MECFSSCLARLVVMSLVVANVCGIFLHWNCVSLFLIFIPFLIAHQDNGMTLLIAWLSYLSMKNASRNYKKILPAFKSHFLMKRFMVVSQRSSPKLKNLSNKI